MQGLPAQQIRCVDPMLVECWAIVYDAGPTFNQHWISMSCLVGLYMVA